MAIIVTRRGETLRLVPLADGTGVTLSVSVYADTVREEGPRTIVEPVLGERELKGLIGQIAEVLHLDVHIRDLNPEIRRALALSTPESPFSRHIVEVQP
jgi:hypothetical protein